ncbi:MAG: EAL domain-containing protein [Acidimicrobiales bacterium]|jgi:diguanylate cyclase (GGDEF)-like protein/PAS domain S-box-containing protein
MQSRSFPELPKLGDEHLIIGVLSPQLAASFFGGVLVGITKTAAQSGAAVIGIQTFDPGDADVDRAVSRFRRRAGWNHFAGVISLVDAVDSTYLFELQAAGIPVILVSNEVEGLSCPVVSSDNRTGVVSAVDHLVRHGHRRIAFVGNLRQSDIRERYEAYRQTLASHGMQSDGGLLFEATDNVERGGAEAGEALLAAGLPSTAVLAATDYNAIGVMGVLKAAGLVLPRDQAIVGFDDTEAGALTTPALSSVRQDFNAIGAKAASLVLELAGHREVHSLHYRVPTRYIVRSSCGCAPDNTAGPVSRAPIRGGLSQAFRDLLTEQGAGQDEAGRVAAHAAEVIADVLEARGGDLAEELTARLAVVAEEICSSTGRFEVVPASVACARGFGVQSASEQSGDGNLEHRIGEISLALSRAYACEQEHEQRRLHHSLRDEYNISLDLLRNPENAQGGLPFLAQTRVRAAYLGLWRQTTSEGTECTDEDPTIELAGSFVSDSRDSLPIGNDIGIESFPPCALVSLARPAAAEITTILPVRTATKDWGLLALVGPLETTVTTGHDFYFQCAALLSMALEQEGTVRSLRSSEERYALAARAANDGLWDWDLLKSRVVFSDRWKAVVGCLPDDVGTNPEEWLERVHPEDRAALETGLYACRNGQSSALESEHRLRSSDGTYRWVHCRALAIPGSPSPATRLVGSVTDITDRRDLEEQLRHQALHDSLTGLPNRALVLDRAERMLATARRTHGSASLLFIDLDNFKEVNDGFGHAAGDKLLAAVAARLRRVTRDTDTVARLGGDEFVVLVENGAMADTSGLLAERVQDVLRPPFNLDGHEYLVSASIGIATATDGTAENLLQEADVAMYKAKSSGKNCCVNFRPRMRHAAQARLQLEMDLASAIHLGQLRVHYQPIFNLQHSDICGMEALVRWQHPERGLLPPSEFIPLAEASGRLIVDLGRYVLSEACHAAAGWQQMDACLDVAVNISARQLESAAIVNDVANALAESGLEPARLVLEVTETAMMHDADAVVARMTKLKSLGVRLSVDDFGTGYSSLASLRRFPVDVLKIDRSFVESISKSPEDASVLQTLVSLGRTLGLEVVAEGVELVSQLEAVREAGCDRAQGFLLGRPMEREQLDVLIATLVRATSSVTG